MGRDGGGGGGGEGGRWREGRTEAHNFKLFGLGGVHAFNCTLLSALTCIS